MNISSVFNLNVGKAKMFLILSIIPENRKTARARKAANRIQLSTFSPSVTGTELTVILKPTEDIDPRTAKTTAYMRLFNL